MWVPEGVEFSFDSIIALEKVVDFLSEGHSDEMFNLSLELDELRGDLIRSLPAHKMHTHYAVTANYYGKGMSLVEAVINMKWAGGESMMKKHGYIVYEMDRETTIEVDPIDGGFSVEQGVTHNIVKDERKGKAATKSIEEEG